MYSPVALLTGAGAPDILDSERKQRYKEVRAQRKDLDREVVLGGGQEDESDHRKADEQKIAIIRRKIHQTIRTYSNFRLSTLSLAYKPHHMNARNLQAN